MGEEPGSRGRGGQEEAASAPGLSAHRDRRGLTPASTQAQMFPFPLFLGLPAGRQERVHWVAQPPVSGLIRYLGPLETTAGRTHKLHPAFLGRGMTSEDGPTTHNRAGLQSPPQPHRLS